MATREYISPQSLRPGDTVTLYYSMRDGAKVGKRTVTKRAMVERVYPETHKILFLMAAGYHTCLSYWHLERMLNGRAAFEE